MLAKVYLNRERILGDFFETIDSYLEAYKDESMNGFDSCSAFNIQAAYTGKTHRAVEAMKVVFGFYVDCKNVEGKPWLTWNGFDNINSEYGAELFYGACFERLLFWLKRMSTSIRLTEALEAWNYAQSHQDFWPSIFHRFLELIEQYPRQSTFYEDQLSQLHDALKPFYEQQRESFAPKNLKLLFVFDHSAGLAKIRYGRCTPHYWLTVPLKHMSRKDPFLFSLFIDRALENPLFGGQHKQIDRKNKFAPLVASQTFDLWRSCETQPVSLKTIIGSHYLSLFGRVGLHASFGKYADDLTDPRLAGRLISNLTSEFERSFESEKGLLALSLLHHRIKIQFKMFSPIIQSLVEKGMGVCTSLDQGLKMFRVKNMLEPVLAIVARNFTSDAEKLELTLQTLKDSLVEDTENHSVDIILLQMVVLLAIDRAEKIPRFIHQGMNYQEKETVSPVKILDFLKVCAGEIGHIDQLSICTDELKEAEVQSLTGLLHHSYIRAVLTGQILESDDTLTQQRLAGLFKRAAGAVWSRDTSIITFPMMSIDTSELSKSSVKVTEVRISFNDLSCVNIKSVCLAEPCLKHYAETLGTLDIGYFGHVVEIDEKKHYIALLIDFGRDESKQEDRCIWRFHSKYDPQFIGLVIRGLKPSYFNHKSGSIDANFEAIKNYMK